MKYLLSSIAIIATVAAAAPAFAQRTGPGPTAETGSGPGVVPPGGFGPTEPPMDNVQYSSPNSPNVVVQTSGGPAVSWGVPPLEQPNVMPEYRSR
jgi:hypothetical protein